MKNTLYIILISFFCGCSHYIVNNAGYIRPPKNQNFSYKNRISKLKDLSVIDTTVIYHLSSEYFTKNGGKNIYGDAYIRFYGNGKFKTQGLNKNPELDDINDIEKGVVGYYIIQGNAVKMHVYSDIDGGSIQLEYGIIDENKNLILMKDNPRIDFNIGYNENKIRRAIERYPINPKIYIKTKIDGLQYVEPNW